MSVNAFRQGPCRSAFTLMDLLALLAVIGMIGLLCIPALSKTRSTTHRAQCASNLRQLALASQLYAGENVEKLPINATGSWPWDLERKVADALARWVPQRGFYCPGTSVRFTKQDNSFLWGGVNGAFNSGVRITGYAFTFFGAPAVATSNVNTSLVAPRIYGARSSQRVLVAD